MRYLQLHHKMSSAIGSSIRDGNHIDHEQQIFEHLIRLRLLGLVADLKLTCIQEEQLVDAFAEGDLENTRCEHKL